MTERLPNVIRNQWRREAGEPFAISRILNSRVHPEGLDVDRIRFVERGNLVLEPEVGHIVSVLEGSAGLRVAGWGKQSVRLGTAGHIYVPPGWDCQLDAEPGTELLRVSSASAAQARGERVLLRDEEFLAACAAGSQMLRWVLTPQYLSRRIFLNHDATLLSASGHPVSWYRTTMFDVAGLPPNDEGQPAFKMAYRSRTEFNVCYDVEGRARVRMARHPYQEVKQAWGPWLRLDGESTYHVNEVSPSREEAAPVDVGTSPGNPVRNKHEVHIVDGHVTLYCLFDPAPTGIENHRPGEYSDYEPLSELVGTERYETFRRELARHDEMVDRLSVAKARGNLDAWHEDQLWLVYLEGCQTQGELESDLLEAMAAEGHGRERLVQRWRRPEGRWHGPRAARQRTASRGPSAVQ